MEELGPTPPLDPIFGVHDLRLLRATHLGQIVYIVLAHHQVSVTYALWLMGTRIPLDLAMEDPLLRPHVVSAGRGRAILNPPWMPKTIPVARYDHNTRTWIIEEVSPREVKPCSHQVLHLETPLFDTERPSGEFPLSAAPDEPRRASITG